MTGILIVIVTHASSLTLPALWTSLLAQRADLPETAAGDLRIRIIDSASRDDTVAVARRLVDEANQQGVDAQLDALTHNVGYAAAINVGRRYRRQGEAVVVLNPDVVLEDGCLARLVEALHDPSIGLCVPRLNDIHGELLRSRRRFPTMARMLGEAGLGDHWPTRPSWLAEICRDDHTADHPSDVEWATGAVVAISPDCDDTVGDWNERFFLYGEEVDYARRARQLGYRMRYLPAARAVHTEGGSGRRPELEALAWWNRIRAQRWHRGRCAAAATWLIAVMHTALRVHRPGQRVVLGRLLPTRRQPIESLLRDLRGVPLS